MPRNRGHEIKGELVNTPLGWAGVVASELGICRIVLPKKNRRTAERDLCGSEQGVRGPEEKAANAILNKAVCLLGKYFSGEDVSFDLPLDLRYYTPFQQSVWRAAGEVPYGESRSYAWIARRIGKPLAARAVGQAMGANPVPIIIP